MRYVTTQIGIYDRKAEDYVDIYDIADLLNEYDYIVGRYAQHHRLCKLAGGHGTCTCGLHERLDQLGEKSYTGGQYGTG